VTQNIERIRPAAPEDRPEQLPRQKTVSSRPAKPFWRRPWIIPLWLVTAAFLYFQLDPFVGVPEAQAPVPPHDSFPPYYELLITHIVFGTISMLTVCLQVWPWLRQRHPVVHRVAGRIYVVACVIAGVCGLIIMPFAPVVGQVGVTMATTLWVIFTLVGFWAARTRRYALHRRFMLYSFALVMNNVWALAGAKVIFGLQLNFDYTYFFEAARWVGWVVNLMLVQWFLYRTARRPVEGPARRRVAAVA
jgi:hypothetical protein